MSERFGDCLRHRDHHALEHECYLMIAERFTYYVTGLDLSLEEARAQYAWDYEAAVLSELLGTPSTERSTLDGFSGG